MTADITAFPVDGLVTVKKFPSRKNHVYLVRRNDEHFILKIFSSDRSENEYRVLQDAYNAGIPVPRPVAQSDRSILMEYVEGRTVNDLVDEGAGAEPVMGVASWLARFHRTFLRNGGEVTLKSDAIFKNFIVADRIYGIDFELSRPGRPEEDVGETISFLLDTYPMFTDEKYKLAFAFINRYQEESGIVLQDVESSIAKSLIEAAQFRPGQQELIYRKAKDLIVLKPFSR